MWTWLPARPSRRLLTDTEGLSGDLAVVRRSGREVTGINQASSWTTSLSETLTAVVVRTTLSRLLGGDRRWAVCVHLLSDKPRQCPRCDCGGKSKRGKYLQKIS